MKLMVTLTNGHVVPYDTNANKALDDIASFMKYGCSDEETDIINY